MKFKIQVVVLAAAFVFASCGNDKKKDDKSFKPTKQTEVKKEAPKKETPKKEVKKETTADLSDKGVGPVKNVAIAATIDDKLVAEGKALFKSKCSACHKIKKRFVGPALKGVTQRRSPEWIMNMILNPEVMVVKNETAKKLLAEYHAPMANQSLTEKEARAIYEYFRTKN